MTAVTAIVPTYNRAIFLGECLDALLGQTRPPEQLIVVDDGSSDDTRAIVAAYGDAVTYRFQPNAGKSAALNLGLEVAKHEAIWIFDDDDVATRDGLARLVDALDRSPQCGFAFGLYDNFTVAPGGQTEHRPPYDYPVIDCDRLFLSLLHRNVVFQPSMLVRRSLYDAVGPFDTAFQRSQDYEMLLRLAAAARACFIEHLIFHQRQHVGDRGPAELRISGHEIWQRQVAFDDRVKEKIVSIAPLDAYLPWTKRSSGMSPSARTEALLVRAAFLAHRGDAEGARRDLLAAAGPAAPRDRRFADALDDAWGPLFERTAGAPTLDEAHRLRSIVRAVGSEALCDRTAAAMRRHTLANAGKAARTGRVRRALRNARMWWMFRRDALSSPHAS